MVFLMGRGPSMGLDLVTVTEELRSVTDGQRPPADTFWQSTASAMSVWPRGVYSTPQANGLQNPTGPLLLLVTDDLHDMHARLIKDGSVVATSPFEFAGGRRFHFRNPSGNVLAVYEVANT